MSFLLQANQSFPSYEVKVLSKLKPQTSYLKLISLQQGGWREMMVVMVVVAVVVMMVVVRGQTSSLLCGRALLGWQGRAGQGGVGWCGLVNIGN